MITARMSGWGTKWHVTRDGAPLTTLEFRGWRGQLAFRLGERDLHVSGTASRCLLEDGDAVVAVAEGVGHKRWTITHGGRTYSVRRTSFWRGDQQILDPDGVRVGHIRTANAWFTAVEADLPGLPDAVGVFALGAVLQSWSQLTTIAAAAT